MLWPVKLTSIWVNDWKKSCTSLHWSIYWICYLAPITKGILFWKSECNAISVSDFLPFAAKPRPSEYWWVERSGEPHPGWKVSKELVLTFKKHQKHLGGGDTLDNHYSWWKLFKLSFKHPYFIWSAQLWAESSPVGQSVSSMVVGILACVRFIKKWQMTWTKHSPV